MDVGGGDHLGNPRPVLLGVDAAEVLPQHRPVRYREPVPPAR